MKLIEVINQCKMTGLSALCHSVEDDQQVWVCPEFTDRVVGFPLGVPLNHAILNVTGFDYYDYTLIGSRTWDVCYSADDYLIDKMFHPLDDELP